MPTPGASTLGLRPAPRLYAPAASGTESAYSGLRLVRTLAMLSVVGHHLAGEAFFRVAFGVLSLQLIMCALATRYEEPRPLRPYALARARRLLVPWVLWSAIYLAYRCIRAWRWGESPGEVLNPSMWLSGGCFHLWFLPFAFCACLVANRALRASRGEAQGPLIASAALCGASLVLVAPGLVRVLAPPEPLNLWLHGVGTLAFGLALGRTLALRSPARRLFWLSFIAVVGLLPLLLGPLFLPDAPLYARYAVSVPLACAGFGIPLPRLRLVEVMAASNLGVYLVHMLVLWNLYRLPGVDELSAGLQLGLAYGLCLALVVLLRRLRLPLGL